MAELTDDDLIKAIDLTESLLAKRGEAEAALKSAFIELSSARFSRSGHDISSLLKAEFYPISIAHAPRTVDFEASTTSIDFQRFAEEGPGAPGEQHTVASLRRREKSGIGGDKAEHPGGKSISEFRKPGLEANRHVRKWIGVEPSRALEKARKCFVQALNDYVQVAELVRELREHSKLARDAEYK